MVSIKQRIKMLDNLSIILKEMKTCSSIQEISTSTKIPTSTIQRYLNREDLLLQLLEYDVEYCRKIREQIEIWLRISKQKGNQQGGLTSQKRYGYQKKKSGKFNGINREK